MKNAAFLPRDDEGDFFDLEYYVPKADRGRASYAGMSFSPFLPGHKIMGGVFQTYFPMQDRVEAPRRFWEWEASIQNSKEMTGFAPKRTRCIQNAAAQRGPD
jgi:hypothetical protein